MRTASLVLGIVGGVLAVIFGVMCIIGGIVAGSFVGHVDELNTALENWDTMTNDDWNINDSDIQIDGYENVYNSFLGLGASIIYVIGGFSIVGAALGIIGGALVKKKNVVAGILMLVASVPSLFTGFGIIASILLIIGGILALIPEKPSASPVQA